MLRLTELANEILPPGVLNAVPGLAAGAALSAHPRVERITFTGATATGRRVLQSAAENLTYATMELGGKNAVLVLADADLDAAVHVAVEGMFYNQGEACTSTARILVQADIHDEFLARFARATEALVVGDGLDPATDIGPMVDAAHRDKVLAYLGTGLDEGARVISQGRLPADKRLKDGYWVAPTILRRHPGHDRRPGRDLRPDRVRHALPGRGRGGRDRQRHGVRADRRDLHDRPGASRPDRAAAGGRDGVRQQLHAPGVPRLAVRGGSRAAGSAARTPWRRCTNSSARRTSASRPAAAPCRSGRLGTDREERPARARSAGGPGYAVRGAVLSLSDNYQIGIMTHVNA